MRFIKRLIVVIVLLLLAFFVYRLISPSSAKTLLYDLKSLANDKIWTHFSLETNEEILTGSVIDITGLVLDETWVLQEFTDEDELLLEDVPLEEEMFSDDSSQNIEEDIIVSDPLPSSPATSSTSSSSSSTSSSSNNGLSNNDLDNLDDLLLNFQ